MSNWKYTDASHTVVARSTVDGGIESCLANVLSQGTPIDAEDPAPPTIVICSPRQIRMALTAAGLRSPVEAAVAAGPQSLKDWYAYASQFESNNPMTLSMAAQLGVSATALASLFALAVTL